MTEQAQERMTYSRIFSGLVAEILFAALPLVVVCMVLLHIDHSNGICASPEWSFGASILFGQSLIKFVSGIGRAGAAATGPVALACTAIIVLGLVPSLTVLTLTLLAQEGEQVTARWLQYAQVGSFALGALTYAAFGFVGEFWYRRKTA